MELLTGLHHVGRTRIAVLHELNYAARDGTHVIAMKDGGSSPGALRTRVVTAVLFEEVFGLPCLVPDPVAGTPQVVPLARDRAPDTQKPIVRLG